MTNPRGIEMEDTSNNFIDMVLVVPNMRYLQSQQIALDHRNEERIFILFFAWWWWWWRGGWRTLGCNKMSLKVLQRGCAL